MRNFWALPAFLRIALASSHSFSVFEDLLAFPQVRTRLSREAAAANQHRSMKSSFRTST